MAEYKFTLDSNGNIVDTRSWVTYGVVDTYIDGDLHIADFSDAYAEGSQGAVGFLGVAPKTFIQASRNWTIAFFVQLGSCGGKYERTLLCCNYDASANDGLPSLEINIYGCFRYWGTFARDMTYGNAEGGIQDSQYWMYDPEFRANWQHICAVHYASSNTVDIYMNGHCFWTIPSPAVPTSIAFNPTMNCYYLGNNMQRFDPENFTFNGKMANMYFAERALTKAEVGELAGCMMVQQNNDTTVLHNNFPTLQQAMTRYQRNGLVGDDPSLRINLNHKAFGKTHPHPLHQNINTNLNEFKVYTLNSSWVPGFGVNTTSANSTAYGGQESANYSYLTHYSTGRYLTAMLIRTVTTTREVTTNTRWTKTFSSSKISKVHNTLTGVIINAATANPPAGVDTAKGVTNAWSSRNIARNTISTLQTKNGFYGVNYKVQHSAVSCYKAYWSSYWTCNASRDPSDWSGNSTAIQRKNSGTGYWISSGAKFASTVTVAAENKSGTSAFAKANGGADNISTITSYSRTTSAWTGVATHPSVVRTMGGKLSTQHYIYKYSTNVATTRGAFSNASAPMTAAQNTTKRISKYTTIGL